MSILRHLLIIILFMVNIINTYADYKDKSQDKLDEAKLKPENLSEKELTEFINLIFANNRAYSHHHGYAYFQSFANKQSPRATVVLCSDSRVQTAVFDGHKSVNDFFIIRNIGNQIETAKGSVEFGVRHLHTPVLMIIGHSGCGAIESASKDFSQLSPAIQKELVSLNLPKKHFMSPIKFNVHQQVDKALKMFDDIVKDKKLIIMGLLYDFRDDFKRGYGSLILVNLNGEQDPVKIKSSIYLKNDNNIPVGVGD